MMSHMKQVVGLYILCTTHLSWSAQQSCQGQSAVVQQMFPELQPKLHTQVFQSSLGIPYISQETKWKNEMKGKKFKLFWKQHLKCWTYIIFVGWFHPKSLKILPHSLTHTCIVHKTIKPIMYQEDWEVGPKGDSCFNIQMRKWWTGMYLCWQQPVIWDIRHSRTHSHKCYGINWLTSLMGSLMKKLPAH